MKIVFMGTPDFAAIVLEKIAEAGYSVVGVVTQPDKAKDRGKKGSVYTGKGKGADIWVTGAAAGTDKRKWRIFAGDKSVDTRFDCGSGLWTDFAAGIASASPIGMY